jgi:mRNA-degrading endonuclease HigB of HigAB toxin-antitoxin module
MNFYEFGTITTDADIMAYEWIMEQYGLNPNSPLVESTDPGVIEFQKFIAKYQNCKIETLQPSIGQSYVPLEIIALILPNSKTMVIISADTNYELINITDRLHFQKPDSTKTTYPRLSVGWNKPMYLFNSIKDKQKLITAIQLTLPDWYIDFGTN